MFSKVRRCELCEAEIAKARLEIIPYTILCGVCGEKGKARIASLPNNELLEIVERKYAIYQLEGVNDAIAQLQARNVPFSIPADLAIKLNSAAANGGYILDCSECGKLTNSLKDYRIVHLLICLVLFFQIKKQDYEACPSCMRKKLIERTLINIVPANIAFPIVLIIHTIQFCRTFIPGHSRSAG
jgi:hypothetical protein